MTAPSPPEATVVARQIEYRMEGTALEPCRVRAERPELYFCTDLLGYGWCVRKGDRLNLGLGRLDPHDLPRHLTRFLEQLVRQERIAPSPSEGWRGHAYRVRGREPRPVTGDDVLLVGDAAGLAAPESGEGILPAVASGQYAARAILEPDGLRRYAEDIAGWPGRASGGGALRALRARIGLALLGHEWFVRHVVLDRWFLHRGGLDPDMGSGRPVPGRPVTPRDPRAHSEPNRN